MELRGTHKNIFCVGASKVRFKRRAIAVLNSDQFEFSTTVAHCLKPSVV